MISSVEKFPVAVDHLVDEVFADRVVPTRVVIGYVLLARDQLLRVEESPVLTRSHLVDHPSLQFHKDRARNTLSRPPFRKRRWIGCCSG